MFSKSVNLLAISGLAFISLVTCNFGIESIENTECFSYMKDRTTCDADFKKVLKCLGDTALPDGTVGMGWKVDKTCEERCYLDESGSRKGVCEAGQPLKGFDKEEDLVCDPTTEYAKCDAPGQPYYWLCEDTGEDPTKGTWTSVQICRDEDEQELQCDDLEENGEPVKGYNLAAMDKKGIRCK